MKIVFIAAFLLLALAPVKAQTACDQLFSAVAALRAFDKQDRAELANALTLMEGGRPSPAQFAEFMRRAEIAAVRGNKVFGETAAVIQRAIRSKRCPHPRAEELRIRYLELSRIHAGDARAFRIARSEAQRRNFGPANRARIVAVICARQKYLNRAQAGGPRECRNGI